MMIFINKIEVKVFAIGSISTARRRTNIACATEWHGRRRNSIAYLWVTLAMTDSQILDHKPDR